MTKVIQYGGADLYPKQREAIFDPARISLIEASVKAGKTVGCLAWLLEQALAGHEGMNYWWGAPVFIQAEIGFRRMAQKLPKGFYKANQSKLTLTLANGARVWFKSCERWDDLYGEDVYAVVLDEASRMREEAWTAIRSTLAATQGPVRMIGNVRGRNNWFYKLCRIAEEGAEGMAYHRITWEDAVAAGVLSRSEIEASRVDYERLGRLGLWNQLFNAIATAEDDNPFGLAAIAACVIEGETLKVRANGDARWVNPDPELWPRAAGIDLAGRGAQNVNPASEGVERDFTAIVKLDRDGIATHVERFRDGHQSTQDRLLQTLGPTLALVDSTGAGDQQVEAMQKRVGLRVEGFLFTQRTRQDLLEGLALAIGENRVHFPDGALRDELDAFEYRFTGGGVRFEVADGHDDLAMALALAVKKLPWRRGSLGGPIGVRKPGGSLWTQDGASVRAEPSLLGDPRASEPPPHEEQEVPPVPMPILVRGRGYGGGSKWTGADR